MQPVRYTLSTAPDWVPRPRQDADGRYLSLSRGTVICGKGHDPERLTYYIKTRPGRNTTGAWVCRECVREKEARRYPGRAAAPPSSQVKVVAPEPPGGWTPRNPFDFLRVRLELEWGPWATWTREQHREHTRRIYHLIGWGDAAVDAPVIGGRGKRTDLLARAG